MKASLVKTSDTISNKLNKMVKDTKDQRAFIQLQLYPRYLEYQRLRWMSENWGNWKALNPKYAERKKKLYADRKGQGMRMLIATGRLIDAVLGENNLHRKLITKNSLIVGVGDTGSGGKLEYAPRVNLLRPFMDFSSARDKKFKKDVKELYRKWVTRNV